MASTTLLFIIATAIFYFVTSAVLGRKSQPVAIASIIITTGVLSLAGVIEVPFMPSISDEGVAQSNVPTTISEIIVGVPDSKTEGVIGNATFDSEMVIEKNITEEIEEVDVVGTFDTGDLLDFDI